MTVNVTGGRTLAEIEQVQLDDGTVPVVDDPVIIKRREVGELVRYFTADGHAVDGHVRAVRVAELRLDVAFS